jgi:leucyl-tRNA synthetase
MAFAGPPEDDIDWADVSPSASNKFLARAWRMAQDVTSVAGVDPATGDQGLRRVTHSVLADAPVLIEGFKFNVVVARLMELVNATRKVIDSGAGAEQTRLFARRSKLSAMILDVYAPYTAEEMWSLLGHATVCVSAWSGLSPTRRCSCKTA